MPESRATGGEDITPCYTVFVSLFDIHDMILFVQLSCVFEFEIKNKVVPGAGLESISSAAIKSGAGTLPDLVKRGNNCGIHRSETTDL